MLSNTCKYALRSIIYIGIQDAAGKKVNVRQIASELEVPMQFLSKILQVYVRKGILASLRGPHGGFSFKKDPFEVTLFDIMVVVDGFDLFDQCVIGIRPCHCTDSAIKKCPVHNNYDALRSSVAGFFKNETIGSIAQNYESQERLFLSL
jgi:Rrf2 family transcriptional regulator, iron-sulfur cluster assembly transcription factor